MPDKRWKWAVTLENPETMPPDTVRGVLVAGSAQTAASRAVREARRQRKGKRYASLVVLLEREASPPG